jgi:hypothetical protein
VRKEKYHGSSQGKERASPEVVLPSFSLRRRINSRKEPQSRWPELPLNQIPASSKTLVNPGSSCATCVPGPLRIPVRDRSGPSSSRRRCMLSFAPRLLSQQRQSRCNPERRRYARWLLVVVDDPGVGAPPLASRGRNNIFPRSAARWDLVGD